MSSPVLIPCAERRPPLSDEALALVARRFAVLAEPARLRLVRALFAGEKHVAALVAETGGTQSTVSRHLQTLSQAQVLRRRRVGGRVFYGIADDSVYRLCALVCGSLERQLARAAGVFGR